MIRIATAIALVLLPSAALAQQTRETFKDANGRTIGWATSNGSGGTSFYDSSGRNTGRAVTGSNGSTTFYDAAGRNTGRSTISNGRRRSTTRADAVSAPPSKRADDMSHDTETVLDSVRRIERFQAFGLTDPDEVQRFLSTIIVGESGEDAEPVEP